MENLVRNSILACDCSHSYYPGIGAYIVSQARPSPQGFILKELNAADRSVWVWLPVWSDYNRYHDVMMAMWSGNKTTFFWYCQVSGNNQCCMILSVYHREIINCDCHDGFFNTLHAAIDFGSPGTVFTTHFYEAIIFPGIRACDVWCCTINSYPDAHTLGPFCTRGYLIVVIDRKGTRPRFFPWWATISHAALRQAHKRGGTVGIGFILLCLKRLY